MKLTVLQWNIWFKEDIRHIAEFLRAHPADIICLQELTIQDVPEIGHTPDYIARELGYNHYYKQIPLGEGKIDLANGIFSRYPITTTRTAWINTPTGSGGFDDEYRAYIEVQLNTGSQKIRVGAVHMSYTNHGFAPTERKGHETEKLVALLEHHKDHFIFTGDLNATPGSPTIQRISTVLHDIGPQPEQKSWTTKPFSYEGFTEDSLNWRLDYMFATQDIKVVAAKVLDTDYSDHLPLWAEIEV